MASKKNEAYIEFKAKTSEFQKGIKQMNGELKNASNALRLNSTQLKGAGDSVELLTERQNLLQDELEASKRKVELTEQSLAECKGTLGENSQEYINLSNAVLAAKNQQEAIKNELEQTTGKLKDIKEKNEQAATSYGQLTDKIEAQENDLTALKEQYTNVVLEQGESSDEAKKLAKQIENLSSELNSNKKKVEDAEGAADKFDKTLEKTGDSAEGFNGKIAAAGAGAVAFGAAVVEAGKASIEAFNEVDEGADNVIKATGATGEAAAELEKSYQNVATNIVGDFGSIGSALGEVNTRFGFTGTEAEEATTLFMKFSEVTGMDATAAVQDVSRAIESAGLKSGDYKTILDSLTKAGQATGVSVETLAGSLTDNGAIMRKMGFDTNDTIAMLAQFEKAGVNSATVTKGMQKAIVNWGKDGKNAKTEFEKVVKGIENGSVSAGEAYEIFGSKAGVELVDAIKSGRFEYEDMLTVIEGSKGALESTFDGTVDGGYELDLAMQNCKLALSEVGAVVGDVLTPVFQTISDTVLPAVVAGFDKMKAAWEWMSEHTGIMTAIATAIGVITTAIVAYNVVQGIKTAMDAANVTTVWALVSAHIAQAAAAMAAIAPYVLIVAAIAAVIAIIVLCVKHWDKIKEKITEVAQKVKEKVIEIKNQITEKLNAAKQKAVEIFENIKKSISEKITATKEKIVSIFNKVLDFFKNNWKSLILLVVNPFAGAFKLAYDNCEGFRNKVNSFIAKIKEAFTKGFNIVKEKIITPIKNAKENATKAIENLRSSFSTKIETLRNKVSLIFSSIKDKITKPIETARDKVKAVVDKIKSFFSGMKLSLPKIKMPKISISGKFSLNPPSVPKFSIKWNKYGGLFGTQGALFTKPTVLQGFGEAGAEYGLPLNERSLTPLATMLNKLTMSGENGLTDILTSRFDAAINHLENKLSQLEANFYVDGEKVAAATATYNDRNSGTRALLAERGLAVK